MIRTLLLATTLLTAQPLFAQTMDDVRVAREAGNGGEVIRLLRAMADKGDTQAMLVLGNHLRTGEFVDQNYTEAHILYQTAANAGNPAGWYYLGFLYLNSQGVSYSSKTFHNYVKRSADAGIMAGQYHVGINYLNGRGVEADEAAALPYFRRAYEQGNIALAGLDLAEILVRGTAVPRDLDGAKDILSSIAEKLPESDPTGKRARSRLQDISKIEHGAEPNAIYFAINPFTEPKPGESVNDAQERGRKERAAAAKAAAQQSAGQTSASQTGAGSGPGAGQTTASGTAQTTTSSTGQGSTPGAGPGAGTKTVASPQASSAVVADLPEEQPTMGPESCAPGGSQHGVIVRTTDSRYNVLPAANDKALGAGFGDKGLSDVMFSFATNRTTANEIKARITTPTGTYRIRKGDGGFLNATWPLVWESTTTTMSIGGLVTLRASCHYKAHELLAIDRNDCNERTKRSLAALETAMKRDEGPFTVEVTSRRDGTGEVVWSQPLYLMPWSVYETAAKEWKRGVGGTFYLPTCQ